jgi:signal transduction histidine kinase
MDRRFQSLQFRLALRLAILFIGATALVFVILAYRAYETAGSLNDRELSLRAEDLAGSVRLDDARNPLVELPPSLTRAYSGGAALYVIRAPGGGVIAASSPSVADRVRGWPSPGEDPSYFRLTGLEEGKDYYGLNISLESAAGPLWVTVAQAGEANTLVQSLLWEFGTDLTWLIPLFTLVTLAIGVIAIRGGLKPVKAVAAMAAAIGPEATSIRLPEKNLPTEIAPLVHAINHALDRLDEGFSVQRQFTANAAHELRTPLAIITGALDSMPATGELGSLKRDVARMNRLVEQLLRVARLDAISLEMSDTVSLEAVASEVVADMAPWAVAQGRAIAFAGGRRPVHIVGNSPAIGDAIRNVVENAVLYSPQGDEIEVRVVDDGTVLVADRGPGIPVDDRERIFDRFWRGKGSGVEGVGLGLSITRDIMRRHAGSVQVKENPGGGTILVLAFPTGRGSEAMAGSASASNR